MRERETDAGFVRFEVQLRPDEAAVVRRALEAAMQRGWTAANVSAGTPPASLRLADALVAVAEQYLAGGAPTGGPPVEVVVHVEAATFTEPEAGGTLDGAGGFRFFRPDGSEVGTSCAAPTLATDPVDVLLEQHRAAGLGIDARTGFPRWDGRPPDYDHAIFCLMAPQEGTSP